MENKKNIFIGVGVVIVIAAIVLILVLTGKKKMDTATVPPATNDQTTTQTAPKKSSKGTASAPARGTLSFISPTTGSTLLRNNIYTVSWTGTADCYDLGYSLNPRQDTPYNFIAKVCENKAGVFSYKWTVPLNTQPGTYGFELKNSGETGEGANTVSFIIK